jgi:alpha-mannosidase
MHTFQGNLLSSAYSRVHRTISSQRVDIKQLCKLIEYGIYNKLEPLTAFFTTVGGIYNHSVILYILKKLITCQAHDSLGGCVTDKTNNDIKTRLIQVNDLVNSLTTRFIKIMAESLRIKNEEFILFNPHVNEQQNSQHYEITLFTKHEKFDLVNVKTGEKLKFDC